MNSEVIKDRKWVKKFSVIFVVVMIFLTLFSNTIMNISLPEVSVQPVTDGKIQNTITGMGETKANSVYEVVSSQTRTVKQVFVKDGDSVKVGDILFSFEDEESDELENELEKLDDLEFQYTKMLLTSTSDEYELENRNIERTRDKLEEAMDDRENNYVSKRNLNNREDDIEDTQSDIKRLNNKISTLQEQLSTKTPDTDEHNNLQSEIDKLQKQLEVENENLIDDQETFNKLSEKYNKYKSADSEAETLKETLEDSIFNLENSKKSDEITAQINQLELENLKKDINKQKSEISKLRSEAKDGKIVAKREGIIRDINIATGRTTEPNSAVAIIEMKNKGFSLSFDVTKEQAKEIKVGDVANKIDGTITPTLSQIQNTVGSKGENKTLTFTLDGDVESGEEYEIKMSDEGKSYEQIIPKSALHSDNNGYFVLTLASKRTPFGGRYSAKRVSVKVLEENEQSVAVSGTLQIGEEVITMSSKPLSSGQNIRLAF